MRILAIETSSNRGSVAVSEGAKILSLRYLDIKRTHSERLLPQIDQCLGDAELDVSQIDAIAVSIGPGSFTGLRIGLGTAKGICLGREIPLMPVGTLKAIAAGYYGSPLPVCVMQDARMREVYFGMYSGELSPIIPESCLRPDRVADLLPDGPVIWTGDGVDVYGPSLLREKDCVALHHQRFPLASALISLALREHPDVPVYDAEWIAELEPQYLRKSQAEMMRMKREKNSPE